MNITGTDTDPVRFAGNQAVKQGGALYVNQDVNMATSGLIGLLKEVVIQQAEFEDNPSFEQLPAGVQPLVGSAILIRGLTQWENLISHSFGDFFVLRDLTIELSQGAGLYLIHSQDVERSDNISFVHLPGATAVEDEFVYNP